MAFLQKPFSVDGLARKVREVLDAAPGPGAGFGEQSHEGFDAVSRAT